MDAGFLLMALPFCALIAMILWRWFRPPIGRLLDRAIAEGDLAPVIAAIDRRPPERRPTVYNRVIGILWSSYEHRHQVVPLVRALVERHPRELVSQYWLRELVTVEPELARALGEEFVQAHFDPALAECSGKAG